MHVWRAHPLRPRVPALGSRCSLASRVSAPPGNGPPGAGANICIRGLQSDGQRDQVLNRANYCRGVLEAGAKGPGGKAWHCGPREEGKERSPLCAQRIVVTRLGGGEDQTGHDSLRVPPRRPGFGLSALPGARSSGLLPPEWGPAALRAALWPSLAGPVLCFYVAVPCLVGTPTELPWDGGGGSEGGGRYWALPELHDKLSRGPGVRPGTTQAQSAWSRAWAQWAQWAQWAC